MLFLVLQNLRFHGENWRKTLPSDARGYYTYLPALFIYNDPNLGFFEELDKKKYYNPDIFYDYRSSDKYENTITKYYAGTAVAQSPFFLIAHGLAHINGDDLDGYSKTYMLTILISGLFYCLIGLVFLRKLMQLYNIREIVQSWTLIFITFGTNLFYYTIVEGTFSHIYSFAFISVFLFYFKKFFETPKRKYIIILGAILGMIVLIRPVNGLIIFALPFLAGNWNSFTTGVKSFFTNKAAIVSAVLFFLILFIQIHYYYQATGSYWVYSYVNEGFNFLSPHFIDILFSFKKGLFLYTPLYAIPLILIFFFWNKSKYLVITYYSFFILLTYVLSSWWMWYYGGSFSGRVYVEYIPFLFLPFAMGLDKVFNNRMIRFDIISFSILILIACQIQTYQYRYGVIHWSEMDRTKYIYNFLRIDNFF